MRRRISIDQLQPGMHIVGLDQPWLKSPFWFHRGRVKEMADIRKLRQSGVREVYIDPSRGGPEVGEAPKEGGQEPRNQGVREGGAQLSPDQQSSSTGESVKVSGQNALHHKFDPVRFNEEFQIAKEIRTGAISAIKRVFEGIKTGIAMEAGPLRGVTQTLLDCLIAREGCMLAEIQLQRMIRFDTSLFSHSVDVCVLSLVIGHHTQLPEDQLHDLAIGAMLHDVGQLRLPRNLLLKKGAFSMDQRNLYQSHPKLGATIVSGAEGISETARRIVAEHHERINGTGYPWGRKGSTIAPLAQLVGLIDRYDALVSRRGGRPPIPPALAVRRLYQLGIDGEFSMEWVEKLIQCLGLYPVGSLVEISTGERGWVIDVNQADQMRPTIKLVWKNRREKLKEPCILELIHCQNGTFPVKIQRVLNPVEEGITEAHDLF